MQKEESLTSPASRLSPALDPFGPIMLADPYPHYRTIREETPVYWSSFFGGWVLMRYADVKAALSDPRLSSALTRTAQAAQLPASLRDRFAPVDEFLGLWLAFQDPPQHLRLRGLFTGAFTPRVVERLRQRVQSIADGLIDAVQARGEMDVVSDFSARMTVMVLTELLGAPLGDHELFRGWARVIGWYFAIGAIGNETTLPILDRTVHEMSDYLRTIVEDRRREPQDDLVSALIAAENEGNHLTDTELLSNGLLLLTAGHDSTANTISSGVLHLLQNPEQAQLLRDDPALAELAVEEAMRYEPTFQFVVRVATVDMEIGGQPIRAGEQVVLAISSANHDPAQFHEPARFDMRRRPNPHMSLGYGPHFCLGARLARMESEIAFNTLLRRLPDLRLASETPAWGEPFGARMLTTLPVTFTKG